MRPTGRYFCIGHDDWTLPFHTATYFRDYVQNQKKTTLLGCRENGYKGGEVIVSRFITIIFVLSLNV
jgi:beta-galactosidase GanA